MIHIKSEKELEIMRVSGKILAEVLFELLDFVKIGVSELEIDTLAEKLIREKGAEPGFKKVKGYHYSVCMATNDVVVHGIPTEYRFKEGDVVGIDCGVYYQGFHTDMAETIQVTSNLKQVTREKDNVHVFVETGKKALEEGIRRAQAGNHVGHISQAIQGIVESQGYSIVRSLVGHGVGRQLHEEPEVPGYLQGKISDTPVLREGMTIAVEVIYNMGKRDVVYGNHDNWTIKTKDGSLSGVFERTIAITKDGPEILTK